MAGGHRIIETQLVENRDPLRIESSGRVGVHERPECGSTRGRRYVDACRLHGQDALIPQGVESLHDRYEGRLPLRIGGLGRQTDERVDAASEIGIVRPYPQDGAVLLRGFLAESEREPA